MSKKKCVEYLRKALELEPENVDAHLQLISLTLEDKLGVAYEPYIFAALQSARVMVVISTRQAYVNAVWVKNEWNRYLALIRSGEKKTLIPAYRDMSPYDLPEEFRYLRSLQNRRVWKNGRQEPMAVPLAEIRWPVRQRWKH